MPYTSGILIGIGETRAERVEALQAIKLLHDEFGHIQVSCCSLQSSCQMTRASQQGMGTAKPATLQSARFS